MLSFQVDPDDHQAMSALGRLAQRLQRLEPLLQEVKTVAQTSVNRSFETGVDPDGNPWARLAPSTLRDRRGGQGKLLQRTGKGRRSVRFIIQGNELKITYLGYMRFHQQGTRKMARRQFAPTPENFERGKLGQQTKAKAEAYVNPSLPQFLRGEIRRTPILGSVFNF